MNKEKLYFFTRIGGKSRIAHRIIEYFPVHYHTYIEPFAGSGQVFLSLEISPNKQYILNDLDKDIYYMWKDIKQVNKNRLEQFNWTGNKHWYTFLKMYNTTDPHERLYKNLYINFYSFSGDKTSGFNKKNCVRGKGFFKTFHALQHKVKRVPIFNRDYKTIIQKFDSLDSFFYLDPPYVGKSKLYNNLGIEPFELKQTVDQIKGKFILSYNNDPLIQKLFSNYRIVKINLPYTSGKHKHIQTELLIMNF